MTPASWRQHVAPAYLLVCLLLGGSTQGVWANAALRLGAIGILMWAAAARSGEPVNKAVRRLWLLVAAMVGLVILQMIPLPPAIWSHLPGRQAELSGLAILGLDQGWQPLSLAPYETLSAALALLPPVAMLAAITILRAYTKTGLVLALLVGAVLGLALGVLQVTSPLSDQGRFYLQPEFNAGTPSGFFANPNHMATLLLLNIPFLAAFASRSEAESGSVGIRQGRFMLGAVCVLLMVAGILLNRSLAAIGILVPLGVGSALLAIPTRKSVRTALIAGAGIALLAFAIVLFTPIRGRWFHGDAVNSISTRHDFHVVGAQVARDYAPVGSGIGTFEQVYRQREPFGEIDPTVFVNHAHDDYLETWIEAGVPGALLILAFLLWWFSNLKQMLRSPASDVFARAGAIGSAAVLVHSLVDFPLRTSAISASFAMCVGLMLVSRKTARRAGDLRAARHIEIR